MGHVGGGWGPPVVGAAGANDLVLHGRRLKSSTLQVLRQAGLHGHGLVQLGDRPGHIIARADLEEAG